MNKEVILVPKDEIVDNILAQFTQQLKKAGAPAKIKSVKWLDAGIEIVVDRET